MIIISIISLVLSSISITAVIIFLLKQKKETVSANAMQITTDIDIGKCSVIGNDLKSFEIKICSNGHNYIYKVKDGELSSIKSDSMPKEYKY